MVELDFLKLEFYVEILFHIECHCLGLRLGLDDVLMEELVGVIACVLGDMGCLRFRLRV